MRFVAMSNVRLGGFNRHLQHSRGLFVNNIPWRSPRVLERRICNSSTNHECGGEGKNVSSDEAFMRLALDQASKAFDAKEVPVGAVLVHSGEAIVSSYNQIELLNDPTAHAEMTCIRKGAKVLGWRLVESDLYVTLEPCPMCAGAVLQARLRRVIYGARSPLLGAHGSWVTLLPTSSSDSQDKAPGPLKPHPFHPDVEVVGGVLENECSEMLKTFFRRRRAGEENNPYNKQEVKGQQQ